MGVSFSKEIRGVLEEIVPISNSALQAVQTVKWITLLQLLLQVINVFLVFLLLLAIIGLLLFSAKSFMKNRKYWYTQCSSSLRIVCTGQTIRSVLSSTSCDISPSKA
jgi:hypothetical protein